MKNFSRLERWLAGAAAALFVFVVVLAALRLTGPVSPTTARDPLKPDAFAKDETGEKTIRSFRNVDLKSAEGLAVEEYGPLPAPLPAEDPPELAAQTQLAMQGLSDLQRVQAIRKAQGTGAALKAMKPLPVSVSEKTLP